MFHRFRRTQHIGDADIDDVETAAEQSQIGIRFVAKEFTMPRPGSARSFVFGSNNEHRLPIDFEIKPLKSEPERASARKLTIGVRCGSDREQFDLAYIHNR